MWGADGRFRVIVTSPRLELKFSTNPFSLSAGASTAFVLALFTAMAWFSLNLLFIDGSSRPNEDFELGGWLYFFAWTDALLILVIIAYEKETCR